MPTWDRKPRQGMDFEQLLLQQMEFIRQTANWWCRRRGLSQQDAEDYYGEVMVKLVENDYAVLRQFQNRSAFPTFLRTVVIHEHENLWVQDRGRWRHSALAKRLGPVAMRLDELVHRDGCTFQEAARQIQSEFNPAPSDKELRELLQQIPRRLPRDFRGERVDADDIGQAPPDHAVEDRRAALTAAFRECLAHIPPDAQLALELLYEQQLKISRIARMLGWDQKRLYRQIEQWRLQLKKCLMGKGFSFDDVQW